MKVKDGFFLEKLCGQFLVIALGDRTLDFKHLIELNETGAFLWEQLQEERSPEELLQTLTAEYAVEPEKAQADIEMFLNTLREADLLA